MNLLALIQAWPLHLKRDFSPHLTAFSKSASSKTIKGSEPPNSITTFFKYFPAIYETAIPPLELPTKLTPRTFL